MNQGRAPVFCQYKDSSVIQGFLCLLLSRAWHCSRGTGKQRYRLLLHFVPGASPALRVLHPEHVPVVIVPVNATKQVSVTDVLCSGHQLDTATAVLHTQF